MIQITKTIEWDMGHRIPNHDGACQFPHGHRYRLEVTLGGPLVTHEGSPNEGMIVDFSVISESLKVHIKDTLDHRFVVYENDSLLQKAFAKEIRDQLKILFVPFIPTSENLVYWCYKKLKDAFPATTHIVKLRLYETPKSWSEYIVS